MLIAWNVDVLEILKDREEKKHRLQFTYNIFDVSSVFLNLKIIEKKAHSLDIWYVPNVADAQEHPYMLSSVNFIHFFVSLISRWIEQRLFHWVCVHPEISIRIDLCAWVFVISFQFKSIKSFTHFLLPFKLYLPCRVLYYCVVFEFFFSVDFQFHYCW